MCLKNSYFGLKNRRLLIVTGGSNPERAVETWVLPPEEAVDVPTEVEKDGRGMVARGVEEIPPIEL